MRKNGEYLDFLKIQLKECVPNFNDVIVAYEPIWSIGSGLVPSFEDILEVKDFVKKYLVEEKKIKKLASYMEVLFLLKI